MVPEPEPPIEVTRQFPPLGGDFCWEWRGNRGGLSGSELWRIGSKHGYFCLRRWPDSHPSPQVLAWIHSRLLAAHASGCSFVPAPMLTFSGVTAAVHENHLWELTPWMPGVADFCQKPSDERIRNALHSVARLHHGLCQSEDPHRQIASGIERRLQGIQPDRLSDRDLIRWNQAAVGHVDPEIATLCRDIIRRIPCWYEASDRCLRQAITIEVPLQACVRDLWHAHVLYTQEEVTGIIDFGAMRVDSVCADLTRLLGSFASGDPDQWLVGLAAYESRRPLSRLEKQLLPAFDLGTTLLSAVQWLRWLLDEQREFEDESLVRQRLWDVHLRLHRSPVELWNCLSNYVGS